MSKNKGKISKVIVQLFLNTHLVIDNVYIPVCTLYMRKCIYTCSFVYVHFVYMLQSLNIEVL